MKLSGESLAGKKRHGIDYLVATRICEAIKECHDLGVEVSIVVGGGNFLRGAAASELDRTRADHMGMLATTINSLGLASIIEKIGLDVRVQTAVFMRQFAEPYIRSKALSHIKKRRVVIFGCGTGNPFFSTDTAASLRAAEIEADVILKATTVDGVYDSDPKLNKNAVRYKKISFEDVLAKNLRFMDSAASSLCKENGIPVLVFSIENPKNIVRSVLEDDVGTIVKS